MNIFNFNFFGKCKVVHLLFCIMMMNNLQIQGQANVDFEQGSFNGWQGFTGTCCPIVMPNTGLVNGRHTITTGNGTDANTCGVVRVAWPGMGNTYSARLGNDGSGRQAERLTYTYTVSLASNLFIYRYAVVLEDPNHQPPDQPRFEIRVLDQNGNIIDPICGYYGVVASGSIPGFQSCGSVRYKDWTTVGIDLSLYLGQNITIEFSTGDCDLGAHFGYAYLDAACLPLEITSNFCANSTSPVILSAPEGFTYLWSNGQTGRQIIIPNPQPGTSYWVEITSVTGCKATLTTQLTATVINAGFDVSTYCQKNVTFHDTSRVINGLVTNWLWEFGDGDVSTLPNPVHVYTNPGPHSIKFTTTTHNGCIDSVRRTIMVIENPVADFTAAGLCAGAIIDISNTSSINTSTFSGFEWNDGNGNTYSNLLPVISYSDTGNYTIEMIAIASNGCTDTSYANLDIGRIDANFIFQDNCEGEQSPFTDSSNAFGNNITQWTWVLGDGDSSTLQNPVHTYSQSGTFLVILDVESDIGCTARKMDFININPIPKADFSLGTDENFCFGEAVYFSDLSQISNGSIISRYWEFGDSIGFSSDINPVYSYSDTGIYFINLVVTSERTCTSSQSRSVHIHPHPIAKFSAAGVSGCQPLSVAFVDSSRLLGNDGVSWIWDFGDGNTSSTQNPVHVYSKPGVYSVKLFVSKYNICSSEESVRDMIIVHPRPVSDFIHDPEVTSIFMPDVSFSETSFMANEWFWDFGDNSTHIGPKAVHRYYEPGKYKVMLVSKAVNGCTDTMYKIAHITPEFSVFAPNAFSPNGDGTNDYFMITGLGIENFNLTILNRWGEEVFVSNSFDNPWNGSHRNTSIEAQNDVYLWTARVKDVMGNSHELNGRVTLVK